jgi:cysteine desulfurase/selenocysteine lyase
LFCRNADLPDTAMLHPDLRRSDFPSLQSMTYFNTAAEGIPPLSVGRAFEQYFVDKQRGMDGRGPHFAEWDAAKERLAQMYGLTADEVTICSCSSEAYNLAAMALRLKVGDEIIVNDLDFPAGATPWLQKESPATVKVWKHRDWALQVDDLIPLLSPKTRLVTTSLVSFFNGHRVVLPEIADAVRAHSPALLAVDVTQALGRIPLDLQSADLIISSTHKWILASHGGGLVGVPARRAADWTVPAGGWFNLNDAFGPSRFDEAISKPGAASFTVGMPNFPAVYAIRAALDYIQTTGVANIAAAADPLMAQCLDGVAKMPVELITPRQPGRIAGILAFRHPKAQQIHEHLLAASIHTMHHAGRIRIAVHGYNTQADVDRLLLGLATALKATG